MTQDHEEQLAEQVAMFEQANALLDRILDANHPAELALMLEGPFGVEWRIGQDPVEAPPTSWEPIVLELGPDVTTVLHLDPLWDEDEEVMPLS